MEQVDAGSRSGSARLQLHWAAQPAAAVGRTFLSPKSDDSHQSFCWCSSHSALEQGRVDGPTPFRAAIRLHDLTLLLLGRGVAPLDTFPLRGRTLEEGYAFFEERCFDLLGKPRRSLERRSDGPPDHPVARGLAFTLDEEETRRLSELFSESNSILEELCLREPRASTVRCWPHHFDLATLIQISEAPQLRTIGVGMVPGDSTYAFPYWYVTAWPYPGKEIELPALTSGSWHRDAWTGAVFPAGMTEGREVTFAFLTSAIQACRMMLGD